MNIQAAKTHLSRLVEEAAAGEEIILAKAGKPIAKLVPYQPARAARVGGQLAGQIWAAPDCWAPDEDVFTASIDAPLVTPLQMVAEEPASYDAKPQA